MVKGMLTKQNNKTTAKKKKKPRKQNKTQNLLEREVLNFGKDGDTVHSDLTVLS